FLSLLRLVFDLFESFYLCSFSFGYLMLSLFILRNYRYVWIFQEHINITNKVNAILSLMLVYSMVHMCLAAEIRIIFFDAHILLLTFLLWQFPWE
ncbi:hypothetical protein PMAYCL1PPCAC_15443, partial [Pristionchus mayeri]